MVSKNCGHTICKWSIGVYFLPIPPHTAPRFSFYLLHPLLLTNSVGCKGTTLLLFYQHNKSLLNKRLFRRNLAIICREKQHSTSFQKRLDATLKSCRDLDIKAESEKNPSLKFLDHFVWQSSLLRPRIKMLQHYFPI